MTSGKTVVHGIIGGIPVPFPIANPDACTDMTCPVSSGSDVTYKNAIFVKEVFPKVCFANGSYYICYSIFELFYDQEITTILSL